MESSWALSFKQGAEPLDQVLQTQASLPAQEAAAKKPSMNYSVPDLFYCVFTFHKIRLVCAHERFLQVFLLSVLLKLTEIAS